jgi:hypothetical protein
MQEPNNSSLLIKIGQGSYPSKPLRQRKKQLQPPNHPSRKEERQLVASLLKLYCYTTALMPSDSDTSATPSIDVSIRSLATKNNNATKSMCQKFSIHHRIRMIATTNFEKVELTMNT